MEIDPAAPAGQPAPGGGAPSLTSRTLRGMVWVFLGTVTQVLLQLVILGVLARLVDKAGFGLVNAALIVIGLITLVAQWIGPAVIQRLELTERHIRTAFSTAIVLGLALMALTSLGAPLLAGLMGMENLVPILRVAALLFLPQSVLVVPDSLLARHLRFKTQTIIQVASYGLGYGLVGVTLALNQWGVWALVCAQLAQSLLHAVLSTLLQPFPKQPLFDRQAFGELFFFGGGFTLAKMGNYFANNGDNIVVGRIFGESALGIYSRAFQMIVMPSTMFGQVLDTVLFPAMSSVQDSVRRLKDAFLRGVVFIAGVVLPVSVLAVILAPEIIRIVLGSHWESAIAPFQILALSMLFRTSYKMSDSLARATGAVYRRAWRQLIFALLIVAGAWAGSAWDLPGVAWGVLLANVTNFILMAHLSLRLLSMSWRDFFQAQLPSFGFALFSGLLIGALTAWLRSLYLSPVIIVIAGVLLMALLLVLVLLAKPVFLLGAQGIWALETLEAQFPVLFPAPVKRFTATIRKAYHRDAVIK